MQKTTPKSTRLPQTPHCDAIALIAKGRQGGRQEVVRLLLEHKFGALSDAVLARLKSWPSERLDELILAIHDAPSLRHWASVKRTNHPETVFAVIS